MPPEQFLTERMLGRLARWLRLLGLDAPLIDRPPAKIPPGAVLLTRRRALAGRPGVIVMGADRVEEQLAQVMRELRLQPDRARLLSRCLDCNLPVHHISREEAAGLVADHTLNTAFSFTRCRRCGKVYWPGSHGQRARVLLEEILANIPATGFD